MSQALSSVFSWYCDNRQFCRSLLQILLFPLNVLIAMDVLRVNKMVLIYLTKQEMSADWRAHCIPSRRCNRVPLLSTTLHVRYLPRCQLLGTFLVVTTCHFSGASSWCWILIGTAIIFCPRAAKDLCCQIRTK